MGCKSLNGSSNSLTDAGGTIWHHCTTDGSQFIEGIVIGRKTDSADTAGFTIQGVLENSAGSATFLSKTITAVHEDIATTYVTMSTSYGKWSLNAGDTGATAAWNWAARVKFVQTTEESAGSS